MYLLTYNYDHHKKTLDTDYFNAKGVVISRHQPNLDTGINQQSLD